MVLPLERGFPFFRTPGRRPHALLCPTGWGGQPCCGGAGGGGGSGAACRGPPRLSFERRRAGRQRRAGTAARGNGGRHRDGEAGGGHTRDTEGLPSHPTRPSSLPPLSGAKRRWDAQGFLVGMRGCEPGEAVALKRVTRKAGKLAAWADQRCN